MAIGTALTSEQNFFSSTAQPCCPGQLELLVTWMNDRTRVNTLQKMHMNKRICAKQLGDGTRNARKMLKVRTLSTKGCFRPTQRHEQKPMGGVSVMSKSGYCATMPTVFFNRTLAKVLVRRGGGAAAGTHEQTKAFWKSFSNHFHAIDFEPALGL